MKEPAASPDRGLPSPDDFLSKAQEYDAVEALEEASEAEGWTLEYRQLEPGLVKIRAILAQRAEIWLMRECCSRQMEVVGQPPPGMLAVLVPVSGTQFRLNGHTIDDGELVVLPPGTDVQFANQCSAEVISMLIPESLRTASASTLSAHWQGLDPGLAIPVRAGRTPVDSLRQLMLSGVRPMAGGTWETELASALVTGLVSLMSRPENMSRVKGLYDRVEKRRALNRAREYIEDHLSEPIRMADICSHSGVSLSTLERIFLRELQTQPSSYILARRLDGVRRELISQESTGKQISQIAMDHGLSHMGRFSATYRTYFGQTPSEGRSLAASKGSNRMVTSGPSTAREASLLVKATGVDAS